jgi:hypothetical protein
MKGPLSFIKHCPSKHCELGKEVVGPNEMYVGITLSKRGFQMTIMKVKK